LEYVGVDKRIILKHILKKYRLRIWSDLTQDWVQGKAPLKKNFGFHTGQRIFYQLKIVGF
jgi:hypothetical protein